VNLLPVPEPVGIRTPVNLAFNAPGITDKFNASTIVTVGNFVLGEGAVIQTDPGGAVQITANTSAILGSIITPGGAISIAQSSNPAFTAELQNLPYAVPNIDLGPHSLLSAAGTVVLVPDEHGYLTGAVLAGGTISIAGNIVAEAGAVLDVSGTSGVLDISPAYLGESAPLIGALSGQASIAQTHSSAPPFRGSLVPLLPDGTGSTTSTTATLPSGSFSGTPVVAAQIDSNGGTITLTGNQELFTDATLRGASGGPAAQGGTLVISSQPFGPATVTTPDCWSPKVDRPSPCPSIRRARRPSAIRCSASMARRSRAWAISRPAPLSPAGLITWCSAEDRGR